MAGSSFYPSDFCKAKIPKKIQSRAPGSMFMAEIGHSLVCLLLTRLDPLRGQLYLRHDLSSLKPASSRCTALWPDRVEGI